MEQVDVLTADGAPTGIVKPKPDVHRDGDWHRAAHLWIVTPDGRVLLQRRAETKESWAGMWDVSVAGHIGAGERPLDAVLREAHEELGLELAPNDLRHLGTLRYQAVLHGGAYIENEFHEVYLATVDVDVRALNLDSVEVAEARLVSPAELDTYGLVPHPESYALLRQHLATSN